MNRRGRQSGQVLVIVAVWMVALIGAAALVLLAGSVEWQRNQLQQLADQAALDAALKIGIGCTAGSAGNVITEADAFVATQRTRSGSLSISGGSCTAPYTGTDTFAGGLSETVHYPYRSHQQQVEVILTLSLPISFGGYMGATNTTVTRRAVAQQLAGSTTAVTATTLSCTGGQFNVAGSVVASNIITLSGGCAVYAHARFDAASGTYSDLGDVSVYAGAQTWVGSGGACVPGGASGSSNAVCADGSELSGHVTMTCGVNGTSEFLSAGDASVNPDPCAAGTAAQPVPAPSTALPPEPNADPKAIATLQGTGGAACTPGGVYPNIQVTGTTVATGLGPVPAKDSSGFYHFKPSCYGYINPAALPAGTSIARVQTGTLAGPSSSTVTPTLPAASKAGNLLVVTLRSTGTLQSTAPAGWSFAAGVNQTSAYRSEIWYYQNNPGGISSATFNVGSGIVALAQMTEWSGVATSSALDQTGTKAVGSPTTTTSISTGGGTTVANELVITNDGFQPIGGTYTQGSGWTNLFKSTGNGSSADYRLNLGAGVATETVTLSSSTDWSLVIAAFKPAGGSLGAVLDPGFYYFNGSGFAGGGGICLNGSTLLARDVTLEFVNQAGFSTGTCAAGGGTACSATTCQFGSMPCSLSACPPNAPADSAGGGFTWFAAPCSSAPAADAASCTGSAWCPAGDRSCWNLLIWAPSSNTGQIAVKGSVAENWLLGSVFWPGTCTYADNGTSMLAGTISCGALFLSAAAASGTAIGSDYGINTSLVEAELVE